MIWLTQWLCPARHCSIALAWDEDDPACNKDIIESQGEAIYRSGDVNRWCGICKGPLHVEHGRTVFKTMDEARAALRASESVQLANRMAIDAHKN